MKEMFLAWLGAFAIVIVGVYFMTSVGSLEATSATDNPTYVVKQLFEHDGCKMNRFVDSGSFVYYSDCTGSTQSNSGKHGKTNVTTTVTEE